MRRFPFLSDINVRRQKRFCFCLRGEWGCSIIKVKHARGVYKSKEDKAYEE